MNFPQFDIWPYPTISDLVANPSWNWFFENDTIHFNRQKSSLIIDYNNLSDKYHKKTIQLGEEKRAHDEAVKISKQKDKGLRKRKNILEKEFKQFNKKVLKHRRESAELQEGKESLAKQKAELKSKIKRIDILQKVILKNKKKRRI